MFIMCQDIFEASVLYAVKKCIESVGTMYRAIIYLTLDKSHMIITHLIHSHQ